MHRRTPSPSGHVQLSRRRVALGIAALPLLATTGRAATADVRQVRITDFDAVADDATVNTKAIQSAIDHRAAQGGGTVVVPRGTFVSGALFLKPKVNLHLEAGAILKCSTDLSNFPVQRTRIEGHFEPAFNPGLINAKGCDGLRITGPGTLDGNGRPIWDLFWKMRNAAPDPHNFPNIGLPRARLAVIEDSRDVVIDGPTFKDSQFWNLHLYRCRDVQVLNTHFEVPDDYKQAPSTDGIDIDSCQGVIIDGCSFSVTDDCIAAKGSKGVHALDDTDSPPVERIRIRNCDFKRGYGLLTCGSEATVVRDVIVENCRIGEVQALVLKLRPDTPQLYENIHLRHLEVTSDRGQLLILRPWTQYADLKGAPPPSSTVRHISIEGVKGHCGSLGVIAGNPGQSEIADILLKDIDVQLATSPAIKAQAMPGLRFENVMVDGKPFSLNAHPKY